MIKCFFKTVLIVVFSTIICVNDETKLIKEKLNLFSENIEENSINYILDTEFLLVFDYEYIDRMANEIFNENNIKIISQSECSFDIEIDLQVGFINKKIRENYRLKRGEIYEKIN